MKRTLLKENAPIMRRMSFSAAVCLLGILAPVTLGLSPSGITLSTEAAYAKNGNGGGGGNGGGNSGGSGKEKSNEGRSSGKSRGAGQARGAAGVDDDATAPDLSVRHKQGITEAILNGRYVMKDARGRTIANRPATPADRRRIVNLLD